MYSPPALSRMIYTNFLKGLEGRSSDYHRYLASDGSLTQFQTKKLGERRNAQKKWRESQLLRRREDEMGKSSGHLKLTEEEQATLRELSEKLRVDKRGFFLQEDECAENYSLRSLFRCRCWQLGIGIDRATDTQLSSSPSLESCHLITVLDFSASYLAPRGVFALGAVLGFCTELQCLQLSGVGISAVHEDDADMNSRRALHFVVLMKALERCKKLEYLDLSCNWIHDHYSMYIMQCILSHPILQELNLENTGLCELVRKKASRLLEDQKRKVTSS